MSAMIDVHQLKVGMFVHLDMGWMSHPFPLSSFRIGSAEQIATIRALGLQRIRWSPQKSDPAALAPASDTCVPAAVPAVDPAVQARRDALAAQREASARVERQYAEASAAWQRMAEAASRKPHEAREMAEGLTKALLDKMLGDRQLCIRLLTEGAGDRATAHALNVTIVALLMGRAFEMSKQELTELGMGALLHDIGKLDVPERLHFPEDPSGAAETAIYRDHVAHGVRRGRAMGLPPGVLQVIAQHHEQADGHGFPAGLTIDRMGGPARIVALVNRYDNLCNPRQPALALLPHEALSLLFAQGQQQFDGTMLSGLIRMMGVYPPGSVVQLTDDRFGMVVSVNPARPLKPCVLVHDPAVPRDEALHLDLETCRDLGIRRSLKPSQLPAAAQEYLSPGRRVAYFFEPVGDAVPQEDAVPVERAA